MRLKDEQHDCVSPRIVWRCIDSILFGQCCQMMKGARWSPVQRHLCQIGSVKGAREAWQMEVDVQKHDGATACAVCCSSVRQQRRGVLGQVWKLPAAQALLPRAGAAHCARMHRGPCQSLQAPHCAGVWPAPSSRQLTIPEKKSRPILQVLLEAYCSPCKRGS